MLGLAIFLVCCGAFIAGLENGAPGTTAALFEASAWIYHAAEIHLPARLVTATADAASLAAELDRS